MSRSWAEGVEVSERRLVLATVSENPSTHQFDLHPTDL